MERGRQQERREGGLSFELGRLLRLMFSCHLIIISFFFFHCCSSFWPAALPSSSPPSLSALFHFSSLGQRERSALHSSHSVSSPSLQVVRLRLRLPSPRACLCVCMPVCVSVCTCLPVCVLVQLFWFVVHSRRRSRQSNVALCLCMRAPPSPRSPVTTNVRLSLSLFLCVCVWRVQRYCFNHCCCFLCPRLCHHRHMYVCSLVSMCVCVRPPQPALALRVPSPLPPSSYYTFTWILHARSIVCSFVLDIF